MPVSDPKILVTGANGQLGRLVIDSLLGSVPASQIIASVRRAEAGGELTARGVEVRQADYDDPYTLDAAFAGVDKLLLVSSSEIGKRLAQHRNVIEAAARAKVKLIVYTSVLHADSSPLGLAAEHLATESLLRESEVPFAILRNGWYTENYTGSVPVAVAHGAVLGSAGNGRIASAARADYAAAAVVVLTSDQDQADKVYELAGDDAYTLTQLAAEIAQQAGKPIVYKNLPEPDYKAALESAGLSEPLAGVLSDSDTGASQGGLFDDSRQLSRLIGRPTTPMSQSVRDAVSRIGR